MAGDNLPSHPVSVTILPRSGFQLELVAGDEERRAIAAHAGVDSIHEIGADVTLSRWRKDGVKLSGHLRARIEQPCVFSLEPVFQTIDKEMDLLFIPEHSRLSRPEQLHSGELLVDPLGDDVPETFDGGQIDVWQPLIEQLVLEIDPWPRAPGAEFADTQEQIAPEQAQGESPFAVLRQLKSGKSGA